jgi:hypothetical protein
MYMNSTVAKVWAALMSILHSVGQNIDLQLAQLLAGSRLHEAVSINYDKLQLQDWLAVCKMTAPTPRRLWAMRMPTGKNSHGKVKTWQ